MRANHLDMRQSKIRPRAAVALATAVLCFTTSSCTQGSTPESSGFNGDRTEQPDSVTGEPHQGPTVDVSWQDYVEGALQLVVTQHLKGASLDVDETRQAIGIEEVDTQARAHFAIREILRRLGDRHSSFYSAEAIGVGGQASNAQAARPMGEMLDLESDIGLLSLPPSRGDLAARDAYAQAAWRVFDEHATACGWIIDLRDNTGGDAWSMIAALAPLLGSGTVLTPQGGLRSAAISIGDQRVLFNGQQWTDWVRSARGAGLPDEAEAVVVEPDLEDAPERYLLPDVDVPAEVDESMPVAVIVGNRTASAAEILAWALRGRRGDLLYFGSETAGLSTGVRPYELVDGAQLQLATTRYADRDGTVLNGSITPDMSPDDPLAAAQHWLGARERCGP